MSQTNVACAMRTAIHLQLTLVDAAHPETMAARGDGVIRALKRDARLLGEFLDKVEADYHFSLGDPDA